MKRAGFTVKRLIIGLAILSSIAAGAGAAPAAHADTLPLPPDPGVGVVTLPPPQIATATQDAYVSQLAGIDYSPPSGPVYYYNEVRFTQRAGDPAKLTVTGHYFDPGGDVVITITRPSDAQHSWNSFSYPPAWPAERIVVTANVWADGTGSFTYTPTVGCYLDDWYEVQATDKTTGQETTTMISGSCNEELPPTNVWTWG